MKIGLYFGSFNPIHIGHLIIASFVADNTDCKEVWMVVSPQNPLKPSSTLLNEYNRLHLVRLATEKDERIKPSDIEFKLPKPSYTIDTLTYLTEKYPQHQFSVVMGSDSFLNLPKWKSFEVLVKSYEFFVYTRPNFEVKEMYGAKVTVLNAPVLDISATYIRKSIEEGKTIRYLVPDNVIDEIKKGLYYQAKH